MLARRTPTFREPHCHSSARRANIFIYIYIFFFIDIFIRVSKQGMLVVCFVLRSERRSFTATRLNTYIYLQSTTLIFFLPQLFCLRMRKSTGLFSPQSTIGLFTCPHTEILEQGYESSSEF